MSRLKNIALAILFVIAGLNGIGANAAKAETARAILAGGCFWCIEKDFEKVRGVKDVMSGYTGGKTSNPTYKTYISGGHREVVQITYDPAIISYEKLLNIFWRTVDPTDAGGQFCDRGKAYSTAIYATTAKQKAIAIKSKAHLNDSKILKSPIVTPVLAARKFFPSEEYHQNYATKNPVRYKYYRFSCGRNAKVKKLWGKQAYVGTALGS